MNAPHELYSGPQLQPSDPDPTKSFVPPAFSKPVGFDRKRIAVLPFTNISPDPQDGYFADGLTEELITTLSKLQGLRVIARTSSSHYSGTSKSVSQIANELQVGTVLEGSVRKAGNKIRITAQLVEAMGQEHLWAEQYDRDLSDIFVIQSDIAKHVATGLEITLLSADKQRIEAKETENVAAHVAYLKGRTLLHDRTEKAMRDAQEQFELAIKRDPNYAQAYAGLADFYRILWDWNYAPRAECEEKSKAFVEKALGLDPDLPEAHLSLAAILHADYQFTEAAKEFQRAITLIPSNATAHHWYSLCLRDLGKHKEALSEILRAEELDPLSLIINDHVFDQYLSMGNEEEALKRLQKSKEIAPEGPDALVLEAYYYEYKSNYNQALTTRGRLKQLWPTSLDASTYDSDVAWLYAKMNRGREAIQILNKMLSGSNKGGLLRALAIAGVYAALGDLDECWKWLDKAFDARTTQLLGVLRSSPFWERERRDPRFGALLERAGVEPPTV